MELGEGLGAGKMQTVNTKLNGTLMGQMKWIYNLCSLERSWHSINIFLGQLSLHDSWDL